MGSDSFIGKLRKILEKPQMPAHLQQRGYDVVVPWHRRLLNSIRPPAATAGGGKPMTQQQRRMIFVTLAIAGFGLSAWGVYRYIASAPQRAQAAFEAGMGLLGPADFKGAVEKFSDSISISETAAAHLERGNAYRNLRQNDQALADWSRAIELDPNMAEAYTARATYYRVTGDPNKALPDLDRAIQLDASVDALFQRGQAYSALGQHTKAIEDYDQAILARREAPYVYLARSMARRALGDEEGYRQDQKTAADLQGSLER